MNDVARPGPTAVQRWSAVLWPSFLVALVVTAVALVVLDLSAIFECAFPRAEGAEPLAAYSVTFFTLWAVGALASTVTAYFLRSEGS